MAEEKFTLKPRVAKVESRPQHQQNIPKPEKTSTLKPRTAPTPKPSPKTPATNANASAPAAGKTAQNPK